jgi:hypothetical protein
MKSNSCSRHTVAGLSAAVAAGLILAIWPASGQGQPSGRRERSYRSTQSVDPNAPGGQDGWAQFSIILQRNIFDRTRQPPRPPESAREREVIVRNPESYFVLEGIVQENNEFIAFVENTQTGEILELRRNDRVARGVVASLSLDTIEYQFEDKTTKIRMGCNLEGEFSSVATSYGSFDWSSTSAPTAQPAGAGQSSTPPGDEADMVKFLMEQRRRQMGQ